MGLFKKKSSAEVKAETGSGVKKSQTVNPDDIWSTPVKHGEFVTVKESKYAKASTEPITGVESIEPEVIKDKMEKLEKELEEKKSEPVTTYKDYDVNPVQNEEIKDAQEEYEKLYKVEHEKYLASHKEEITPASEEGIGEKVQEMVDIHEEKVRRDESTDYGFAHVDKDEVEEKLSKLPYAKKPEDYPEYKDIKEADKVSESDIEKLGTIDHSGDDDEIKSVSQSDLDEKVEEFEKQYGDRKKQ